MADISKCAGTNCPVKEKCYRFTAPSSNWQSWCEFWKSNVITDKGCKYFWPEQGKAEG